MDRSQRPAQQPAPVQVRLTNRPQFLEESLRHADLLPRRSVVPLFLGLSLLIATGPTVRAADPIIPLPADAKNELDKRLGAGVVGEKHLKQSVITSFTAGEPLVLAGLQAGQSCQVTVAVRVADISDPTDITHTGSLNITYTYAAPTR